jgi:excinuclease ABC subunit A
MAEKNIHIKGARANNLKNIELHIKHGKLTVFTGLSGSGKSSLAFDTLYAEGQRRYVESLSSYARQFLGKLEKPEVEFIKGISPSIAIQQKVISTNPRSTVGTSTEIYDYLKVLFARIGKTYSPISGNQVVKHTVSDVIDYISKLIENTKIYILSPIVNFNKYGKKRQLSLLLEQGYSRLFIENELIAIEDIDEDYSNLEQAKLVIDRIKSTSNPELLSRISDSIGLAFSEGDGSCELFLVENNKSVVFSNKFELDSIEFIEPSEHFFTFNNPFGACKKCEGFGSVIDIDPKLVIPDTNLSVYQGAIAPWKGETMGAYLKEFILSSSKYNFPIHRPINDLNTEEYNFLWNGNSKVNGINAFFSFLESQSYKIQYRVLLSRYRGKTICPDCRGTRLRKDTNNVRINDQSISNLVLLPISECLDFFKTIKLNDYEEKIASRILIEIKNRLQFLCDVGLSYLTLNRTSNSLSGGESQRINLATSLGSSLVGSLYILDEPSIGLHPRDTEKLIVVLKNLRDIGNTVIVVEHEEDIMREADEIIDIGPMAGINGGEIVFQGNDKDLRLSESLTAQYLTKKRTIPIPSSKRKSNNWIKLEGARENNLKKITINIPLFSLVCVSGVSGSGKSTLIKNILYPAIRQHLGVFGDFQGEFDQISGDLHLIKNIEMIDQNPIGKSSRSNPVTYVKAFDDIRELFAKQTLSKHRGYKAGRFSFNVDGGRCEVCEGEGEITVGMQFMADVHLKCDACNGSRFKQETLEITYQNKNISEILNLDITEAISFFNKTNGNLEKKIIQKLEPLESVGLGYIKLGQSSSTLSGGEAQRIKLASFLSKGSQSQGNLFIFDEPTTGLHFYDIEKLLIAFQKLINIGNSIVIIEHNGEVLKCADWIIDIGPEGGTNGGSIEFEGSPEELIRLENNYTAKFLKQKFN